MIRFLRTLVWLRWRTLVNTLKGGFRRDPLESTSRLLALIVAGLVLVLSFAAATGLGILGWFAGYGIGEGKIKPEPVLILFRILLFLLLGALTLAPLGRSLQGPSSGSTRFALIPIPVSTLHLARLLAAFLDPWTLPVLPLLLLFPAGLAASGRGAAAGAAGIAGCAMLLVIATLGSLSSLMVQWFLLRRGRAEIAAFLILGLLLASSLLPVLMEKRAGAERRSGPGIEHLAATLPAYTRALPSELYASAVRHGIAGELKPSLATSGVVVALGGALFALSARLNRHLLESPEEAGPRRRTGSSRLSARRWPGLSAPASAVATAQIRTVLRTVRGRFVLYFTAPMAALLGWVLLNLHGGVFWRTYSGRHGYLVLTGAAFVAITSTLPLIANLFAVDRSGLTRQLLAPLGDRDLLLGKLAGSGLLYLGTLVLGVVGSAPFLIGPSGPTEGGWLLLGLTGLAGGVAIFLTLAPLLAFFSLAFPKSSDLNKLGRAGNPHQAASLLASLAAMLACAGFSIVLALAYSALHLPWVALGTMLVWGALAAGLQAVLLPPLARMLGRRRDNLALIAESR